MKAIFILAMVALFAQGLVAGPIGNSDPNRSTGDAKPEKDELVETPIPKKKPVRPEPKDEENTIGSFQGDMMLTNDQLEKIREAINDQQDGRQKRKATSELSNRWPQKIIPYVIEGSSQGDSAVIRAAMDHWQLHTCLRFEPRNSSHSTQLGHNTYLSFIKEDGCWSSLGRSWDNAQAISIGQGCADLGIVAHEIGHAIGFHHEQSRPDRDDYITVHFENILDDYADQFYKYSWDEIDALGVEYDIGSLMHYGSYGASKDYAGGLRTISTNNPADQDKLGNRDGLSFSDIALANLYYECDFDCQPEVQCENHGIVNANCECVCPRGFTGHRCELIECAQTFTDLLGVVTSPSYPNDYDNNVNVCFSISGPPGSTIQVTFQDMDNESHQSCGYDAVEVCGNALPSVQISSGKLVLAFTSDNGGTGRGFESDYDISSQG